MKYKRSKIYALFAAVLVFVLACPATVLAAAEEEVSSPAVYATFWSLVPPVVAIVLALITKEVYSSLFVGILVGAILYSGGNFEVTVNQIFSGGMISVLSSSSNVGILVFLVILGTMVCLMNRAGGSAAFGRWASKHIKTRVGAELATILLGVLIFIDDYFNCLTVGSVMRPITDQHNVSRAKLAYLIDATAAPICIIAPISSWAAAVSGFVPGEDGMSVFVRAIPYNYYAILTIVMMVSMVLMKEEFGSMGVHESNALKGDLFTTAARPYASGEGEDPVNPRGKVMDLLIPIISLVICCVIGMIYTGGFFSGTDFVTAFSQSDASVGLVLGSFFRTGDHHSSLYGTQGAAVPRLHGMYPGGLQIHGSSNTDPDLCMDLKEYDRQSWGSRVCSRAGKIFCRRTGKYASGNYFHCGMLPGFCNRYFLGNLWYSDPHCSTCI